MRLIDADELREDVDRTLNWDTKNEYNMYSDVMDMIDEAPTVEAEPIIRCKDCKYFDEVDCEEKLTICVRNGLYKGFFVSLNDYCSFAERISKK